MGDRLKIFLMCTVIGAAFGVISCGGSSSTNDDSSGGGGVADVKSLSSLPTMDLSQYDSSTASANLAVPKSANKGMQEFRKEGGMSRAGCESNMHKKEIFRMSQTVQLDRCYPEAMEKAGFITIPADSYAYFGITPPEQKNEDKAKMCDGIPAERVQEKEKCLTGNQGPSGGSMKMRIGRFAGELRIDMCEGTAGSEVLVNEATYNAAGSVYTAGIVRIGEWGGGTESSNFAMTVDVGTGGSVTDGVPVLGTGGYVIADGQMNGNFGHGIIHFESSAADSSNIIRGSFASGFTDPFSNTASSFTGKTYAHFGGSTDTGCAQFSFTGAPPAMRVQDMIPYDIGANDLDNFLQSLGLELGINLTAQNYQTVMLCQNPNFDPANPSSTVKSMIALVPGSSCDSITNTGVECFSIGNGTQTTDFGTEIVQSFTSIASTASPFYSEVAAFDLSGYATDIQTIAFARNWDCTGTFTEISFADMTAGQMAAAETAMESCKAIEEKARANEGMGGYDCNEKDMGNSIEKFKDDGGPNMGKYGGVYANQQAGNQGHPCQLKPERIFINLVDEAQNQYCIPTAGNCELLTMNPSNNRNSGAVSINYGGTTITDFEFGLGGDGKANTAVITLDGQLCAYGADRPEFTPPSGDGGTSGMPQACKDLGFATEMECRDYCMKPGSNCR